MGYKSYRRKMLLGIGTVLASSLAGCSQQSGSGDGSDGNQSGSGDGSDGNQSGSSDDSDTSSDEGNNSDEQFEYPDGFSETGVEDFAVALGMESNYYSQRYLQIEASITVNEPDTEERTLEITSQIDSEQELRVAEEDSPNRSRSIYYGEGTSYSRTQEENKEPSYDVRDEFGFGKQNQYRISFIKSHVIDVEFESAITEQGTVEYTATEEAYDGNPHPIRNKYVFDEIDVTVEVDENGLIRTLAGTVVNGDATQEFSYEFSYEEVDITEPDWVSEARESQPAISVSL